VIRYLLIILIINPLVSNAQGTCKMCQTVNQGDFKKVEKLVLKEIKKNKNANMNLGYASYSSSLDSIVNWLNRFDCVREAIWDKCAIKTLQYPGQSIIGVKFNKEGNVIEKCYTIQTGKTRWFKIFGWKILNLGDKDKLIYLNSTDCEGFVDIEKTKCLIIEN
jgi:hypothetical protein